MTAVYSCVRIPSEAITSLSVHVYRYNENGGKEKALDHLLYYLLHDEPNSEMTSFAFRETLMAHLALFGNAYAQIIRNGKGEVVALYRDKNGMPEVAMHWQHRFNHAVKRYNDIFKLQMQNITPHICRHTYCSNQARAGMNPKPLQYLMGHSDIGVTMNTYTHLGMDDAKNEMIRLEELEQARKEIEKTCGKSALKKSMFKIG